MFSVCVMMSTYNGAKYLPEQIDSILGQKNVKVDIWVRDDGSTDETCSILRRYSKKSDLRWYQGKNCGPARSFIELLHSVPLEYDFYAFADQDDIWFDEKLISAVSILAHSKNIVKLYHSCVYVSDENAEATGKKFGPVCGYNFATELLRNNAVGCTFVFNLQLLECLRKYIPKNISMHDQWILLVCLGVGGLVYVDSHAYMFYRQHQNNTVGTRASFFIRLKYSVFFEKRHSRRSMAVELYQGYEKYLLAENKDTLKLYLDSRKNILSRIRAMKKKLNCEKMYQKILCRYSIISGKF